MHIELSNHSRWENHKIKRSISSIAKDLRLKGDITFVFQTTWTEIDDYGDVVPGTEAEVGFDGDAFDNAVVRVCIDKSLPFPFTYDINEQLKGFYLRHIVEFKSAHEMFLYMTAHELRHLYQWENPAKTGEIRRLLRCDDETDADIYAIMTLSRYRNRNS